MTERVRKFTLHNNRGQSVLESDLEKWKDPKSLGNDIFAPVIRYSWICGDLPMEAPKPINRFWYLLPDASGFICFERGSLKSPSNCILLDSCGKDRIRLSVPWTLTEKRNPASANSPTSFALVSEPLKNPADGRLGEFGVTAWVEHAGMYYFELDYHRGKFLWGREIRD